MKIKNYFPVNRGALVANFHLCVERWGNFNIPGMKLFNKNGARWVSFPSKEKIEAGGTKKYYPTNWFDEKGTMDAFRDEVMKALDQYLLENPQGACQSEENEQEMSEDPLPF